MPSRTPRTRWGLVGLAFGAGAIASMQVGKVPPAIVAIRADLLIGLVTAGWVIAAFNMISAAGGSLVGGFADRFGHRRSLLFGLGCLALGSLFGGMADSGAQLLAARFIEGIGFVAVVVAAPSLIAAAAPAERHIALALWSAYMPFGMALMLLLSPALLASLGWRGLWFANVGLIVLFALLFAYASRHARIAVSRQRRLSDLRRVLGRPGPWLLAGCFAAYALQWHALMAWLPTFLVEQAGQTVGFAALAVAAIVAINIPGNLLGGWLLRRGAARWAVIAAPCLLIGFLGVAVLGTALAVAWKIVLALMFSLIGGLLPAAIMAAIPAHAPSPDQIGAANGVVVQGSNIGTLIGPPTLAALVASLGGWGQSAWLLALAGATGAGLALLLRRIEGCSS